MNRISQASVGAVFAVFAAIAPAYASTDYTWSFTAQGFNAHGTLTTDSAPDVAGNIIAISGLVNGVAITGVGEESNLFTFDNKLNPTGDSFVDNPGVLFETVGTEYNLYSVQFLKPNFGSPNNNAPAPGGYNLDAGGANGYGDSVNGDFVIALASSAPEPAYWLMMLAGFGMLGSVLRLKRKFNLSAI